MIRNQSTKAVHPGAEAGNAGVAVGTLDLRRVLALVLEQVNAIMTRLDAAGTATADASEMEVATALYRELMRGGMATAPGRRPPWAAEGPQGWMPRLHAQLVERMGVGVVLLDEHKNVLWFDGAAEKILVREDGLVLERKGVAASDPVERVQLAVAIEKCLLAGDDADTLLSIHRLGDRTRLEVLVTRIHAGSQAPSTGAARVALFVNEAQRKVDPTVVQGAYGLSRAEARIVAALASGTPSDRISAVLNIKPNTVRAHLKSAYRKVGVTCQSELVATVLSGLLRFAGADHRPVKAPPRARRVQSG